MGPDTELSLPPPYTVTMTGGGHIKNNNNPKKETLLFTPLDRYSMMMMMMMPCLELSSSMIALYHNAISSKIKSLIIHGVCDRD